MKIGTIKPTATIVAQFAAGVEVTAIQHDGKMFLPVVGMGSFASDDDEDDEPKKKEPVPPTKAKEEAPKKEATSSTKKYTEDELMDMDTKELLKMCKSMGIDPDKEEGKNTNKKLRLLILSAQDESESADNDDEEDVDDEPEASKSSKKSAKASKSEDDEDDNDDEDEDDLTSKIVSILEDFDGGKKNKKKTIAAICDLSEDADKDEVTEFVEKFEDDADMDVKKLAAKIAKAISGDSSDDDEDEDDGAEDNDELVDASDLKVGDRVSVWWNDDNQDWYDGEVKSISKKGKVLIAYDDDTEEVIDPEIHTKIKRAE